MATGQRGVHGDLVSALIDARETPASARFDEELAAAVERGALDPEAAARLHLWHRAAIAEVDDYVRTVLPATLDALAKARADARRRVEETAAAAAAVVALVPAQVASAPHEGQRAPPATRTHAPERHDTPVPASATPPPGPSSLESRPSRMMVADLVASRAPVHHEHS